MTGAAAGPSRSPVPPGRNTSVVEPHTEQVRLPSGIFSPQMLHSGMAFTLHSTPIPGARCARPGLETTHHSPLTTHHSPLTTHHSPGPHSCQAALGLLVFTDYLANGGLIMIRKCS